MGFIVKSDAFSTNIQRINFLLELAEAQFNMYSGYIAGVLPKNASTKEETTNTNREEDKAIKMCKMIAKIKSLQKIVDSLKGLTVVLTDKNLVASSTPSIFLIFSRSSLLKPISSKTL